MNLHRRLSARQLLHILLSISLVIFGLLPHAQAQNGYSFGFVSADDVKGSSGDIYVSEGRPGAVLMKINLWGAVRKAGIHYVPPKTDFVTLLSYAGGPLKEADLEEAYIKRQTKDESQIIQVNIKDLINPNSVDNPTIEPNDIIVVPAVEPTISDASVRNITVIASVLGVILSSIVIHDRFFED